MIDEEARELVQRAYDRTMALLVEKQDFAEAVAQKLLSDEVLSRDDMIAIVGPRHWSEKSTYEDLVADTGGEDENTELPAGLESVFGGKKAKGDEKTEPPGPEPVMAATKI